MRVVAGAFKGRRLQAPRGRRTRPTSDKVREAVFSILGDISGAHVLDLYAGSGALGVEALSRGAADATFVDRDRNAARAIRQNLETVGVRGPVIEGDALVFLRELAKSSRRVDLVFLDPPYDSAVRLAELLSEQLPAVLSQEARIVTESDKRAPLELSLPLELERVYGDTRIGIHRA